MKTNKSCEYCGKPIESFPSNKKYCGNQALTSTCSYIANQIKQKMRYHNKMNHGKVHPIKPCVTCGKDVVGVGNAKYCGHRYEIGTCANNAYRLRYLKSTEKVIQEPVEVIITDITPRQQRIMFIEQHNKRAARYMYVKR